MATFTWKSPVSGDWDTAANWDQGAVPDNLDTAIISQVGSYTVASAGAPTLRIVSLLEAAATLAIAEGSFATNRLVNNGSVVVAGDTDDAILTIKGSAINGGEINLSGVAGGVATLQVSDEPTRLTGGGSIVIEGAGDPSNGIFGMTPESYLINKDNTIEGSGALFVDLYNGTAGLIDADVAGETLEVRTIGINAGIMQASNGGIMVVSGSIDFAADGVLKAIGTGSQAVMEDLFLTGPAKVDSASGGSVAVTSFNAVFGSLTVEGKLSVDANLFDTSPAFDFDSVLAIEGTLINHGVINVAGYDDICGCPVFGALLIGDRGAKFEGGGSIILGGDPGTALIEEQFLDFRRLTNVDNHIEGAGAIGAGSLFLRNMADGIIEANVTGEALVIDTGENVVSNRGTLMASDGGLLTVVSDLRGGNAIIDDAILEFQGMSNAAVSFISGQAVLELDKSGLFAGLVTGMDQSSDYAIDLTDIDFATASASFRQYEGKGSLMITDGTVSARLRLVGEYVDNVYTEPPPLGSVGFVLSDNGFGGTSVSYLLHV